MARLKVGDLELTERKWPLLVRAGYETNLLHISTHNGVWKNPNKSGRITGNRHFVVTQCNRPFEFAIHFKMDFSKLADFQLCSTCGTRADFEAAIEVYAASLAAQRLERQEKEAERQAERERAATVRAHLASEIVSFLSHLNAFEAWAKDGKVFIRYEGVLYRLPIVEERE